MADSGPPEISLGKAKPIIISFDLLLLPSPPTPTPQTQKLTPMGGEDKKDGIFVYRAHAT